MLLFFLSLRKLLHGISLSFLYQVKNELPSTFKAYRYQQHRWSCGPANLFRKMVIEIIRNKARFFIPPMLVENHEDVILDIRQSLWK